MPFARRRRSQAGPTSTWDVSEVFAHSPEVALVFVTAVDVQVEDRMQADHGRVAAVPGE